MSPSPESLSQVDFGALTKALRTAKGLTQEQLARELDVTFGTVNGWENGRHAPIASLGRRIVELARTAGISDLPRKPAVQAAKPIRSRVGRRGR